MVMGEVTVAVAVAVRAVPSAAVAVMVQEPGVSGAVKSPVPALMVPQDAVKVAGSLAVNCGFAFSATLTWVGETVMGTAAATVSFAVLVYAGLPVAIAVMVRSEEHTSELQSLRHLVCRLL